MVEDINFISKWIKDFQKKFDSEFYSIRLPTILDSLKLTQVDQQIVRTNCKKNYELRYLGLFLSWIRLLSSRPSNYENQKLILLMLTEEENLEEPDTFMLRALTAKINDQQILTDLALKYPGSKIAFIAINRVRGQEYLSLLRLLSRDQKWVMDRIQSFKSK